MRGRGPHRAIAGSLATALGSQAALVVSGILVARMLGPEDRGFLALIILVPTIVVQAIGLGISSALPYFLARESSGAGVVAAIRRPAMAQVLIGTLIHAVAVVVLFGDATDGVRLAAAISLLIVPGALVQELAIAVLQGIREFRLYNTLRLLPVIAYAVGVLGLFLASSGNLVAVTAVSVASTVTFALLSTLMVRRATTQVATVPARFRPILGYGLRGYLSANTIVETYRLDQAIIGLVLPPAALGYYVVGMAFTNLPKFMAQSVGIVAYPTIAGLPFEEARASAWRYVLLVAATSAIVVAGFIVVADWAVVFFFGAEFAPAVGVTRLLMANALLFALRRILTDAARGLGISGRSSIAELASLAVFFAAVALLDPRTGIESMAIALIASSSVAVVILATFVATARPDRNERQGTSGP